MQIWDKQKNETYEQFDLFTEYRDNCEMRDLTLLASTRNKGIKQINNWAKKYNWENRAREFDTHNNNHNNNIHKQLSHIAKKQANQIFEISDSLDSMANAIKDKISSASDDFDDKRIDSLLKMINSYMKSISDIQKIFQMISDIPIPPHDKEERIPFSEIIINDQNAYDLASKLLVRINKVKANDG